VALLGCGRLALVIDIGKALAAPLAVPAAVVVGRIVEALWSPDDFVGTHAIPNYALPDHLCLPSPKR